MATKPDPHRYRRGEPDFTMLVRGEHGQITHNVSFRKGAPGQAYVEMREWCWHNGINFSDIINSIMEPLLHFCCNFARRDKDGNIIITMNFGDVKLEQVYIARQPIRHGAGRIPHLNKTQKSYKAKRITLI